MLFRAVPRVVLRNLFEVGYRRYLTLSIALVAIVGLAPLCLCANAALAQEARPQHRIGELWFSNPDTAAPYREPLRKGLADLGYQEGRDVVFVTRYAHGDKQRIPILVDELISEKVNIMILFRAAIPIAKQRSPTIPIVCPGMGDPVAEGIVASLARPGGNVTGLSWQSLDSIGKRVELARELIPDLRRVAMIFDAEDRLSVLDAKGVAEAARSLGIVSTAHSYRDETSLEEALLAVQKLRPQLLFAISSPLAITHRKRITSFATTARIPLVSEGQDWARAGTLLTYGADAADIFRRGAVYVDKILKGAKPGDLPIEQPVKFELIVNLSTAKAIGLAVPKSLLSRANEVIQ